LLEFHSNSSRGARNGLTIKETKWRIDTKQRCYLVRQTCKAEAL
jgi:hypothetical protein